MIVSHSFKECLQLISIIYSNLENEKKEICRKQIHQSK